LARWQRALLEAVGLDAERDRLPSAAVTRAGEAGVRPEEHECWALLECVHFAAGLNDMAGVVLSGAAVLDAEQREALAETLASQLREVGYELVATRGPQWLVRCPRHLDARTLPPTEAFDGPLQDALPSGTDAAELRRLMTELQMVLHEHPVNQRRARAGLPGANSAWIWSVAALTSVPTATRLPIAFGAAPYLKGLYLLHSQSVSSAEFDPALARSAARDPHPVVALIESDESFERTYLEPALAMLRRGVFGRLMVYLDRWKLELRRRDLLRLWRGALPFDRWPA
jgi:Uncharacterized protein conserved in bacteria